MKIFAIVAFSSLMLSMALFTPARSSEDAGLGADPVGEAVATISQNFERDIRPLVNRACVACHDSHARPEGFLGEIPGIRSSEWKHIRLGSRVLDFSRTFPAWSEQNSNPVFFLDQIRAVIQQNKMPLWEFRLVHHLDGRLLKSWEKQKVIQWTKDSETLLAQADASRPTVSKLFLNRCLGCHNAANHAAGLVFAVDGDQIKIPQDTTDSGIPYLAAGDPENSAVYLVLLADATARKDLPKMPRNSDAFTDEERSLVRDWILQLPK